MTASQWFHVDLKKAARYEWLGYIREIGFDFLSSTRSDAQEEARRIITETTGVADPKVVWNEC